MSGRFPPVIYALSERASEDADFIEASLAEIAEYDAYLGETGPRFVGPSGGPLFMGRELRTVD